MIISRLAVIFGEPGNKFQENLKILSYFAKNILTNRFRYNIIIKPCRIDEAHIWRHSSVG